MSRLLALFWIFLKLGLTSFGGPVAHIAFFRQAFVDRRQWMSASAFNELVAICQFLPGPASSQLGMALGLTQAGYKGAFIAWLGFTLPSACLMLAAALGLTVFGSSISTGVFLGLKIVVVAVVAQAIWGMGQTICTDARRAGIMAASTVFALTEGGAMAQWLIIMASGLLGLGFITPSTLQAPDALQWPISRREGLVWLLIFLFLLLGLPIFSAIIPWAVLALFDIFYRSGALVFGGGHVVLPLLQSQLVPMGWVSNDTFLAGYGLTQAMPGPLFSFSAFLGASLSGPATGLVNPVLGGLFALIAIFLPGFLLLVAALPFWMRLRESSRARAALAGLNAGVLGLLIATFYDPVFVSAVAWPQDMALTVLAFVALVFWRLPAWVVVVLGATIGGIWF